MTRLRARLSRVAREHPRGLARGLSRYLVLRRRARRELGDCALDVLLARLDAGAPRDRLPPDLLAVAIELGDALVHRTAADTCLVRALARYALLREHGAWPTLVIGIDPQRAHTEVDAIGHAWVEVDGSPLPAEHIQCVVESLRHPRTSRLDRSLRP